MREQVHCSRQGFENGVLVASGVRYVQVSVAQLDDSARHSDEKSPPSHRGHRAVQNGLSTLATAVEEDGQTYRHSYP